MSRKTFAACLSPARLPAAIALGLALTAATAVAGGIQRTEGAGNQGNPRVLPPGSTPYGMTYGQWGAQWWKWALMIPTPQNPLNDPTGANGAVGQSGQVWFLAGTFCTDINCTEGIATRSLAIPAGKALFFPIINSYCSDLVGSGTTEAELRDCAKGGVDLGVGLACEVDGVPIQNLAAYRAVSSLFTFGPVPADNIAGAPAGSTSIAVTDGYWIMLAPLPVGPHSVHFAGAFGPYFSLDVTYHLTITPGEAQAALDNPDESTAPAAGNPGPAGSGATWGRVKSIYR